MHTVLVIIFVLCVRTSTASASACITKSGVIGTCKVITECEAITENLNSGDFGDLTPCEFTGSIGIFCCPSIAPQIHSQLTNSCQKIHRMREQLRPSIAKYDKNSAFSSVNELSFMAQIFLPQKGFVGSGVLISESFVLTSAHIIYARRSMPHVRLGKTTLDDDDDDDYFNGLDIIIKQVIPHELFMPRELYYDIALLLMEKPVKFRDFIWPACLHNSEIKLSDSDSFVISGWKCNGRKTNELMKGEVLEAANCQELYADNEIYSISLPNGITNNLFCGRIFNCNNSPDSDGPMFIFVNNTFFIYAFATATNTNCNSNLPGIYTRISDVVDWIENIIFP